MKFRKGSLYAKFVKKKFKYHRDIKKHYISEHSSEELQKNGISVKSLRKRLNKRENKMLSKSDVEAYIEKEEEKRALQIDENILEKVEEMRFTFPFI